MHKGDPRCSPGAGQVPMIANGRDEQIYGTLEAGMDDVVSKPFRVVELLRRFGS